MKIKWTKETDTVVVGRVGDVECFQMIATQGKIELVCSLPETTPGCVGRQTELHTTPKLAAQHAQHLFDHWYKRLHK